MPKELQREGDNEERRRSEEAITIGCWKGGARLYQREKVAKAHQDINDKLHSRHFSFSFLHYLWLDYEMYTFWYFCVESSN